MTELEQITTEIKNAVDTAASIATVIVPQYTAFIVLGQAVAKAMPDLYAQVAALVGAKEPTQEEKEKLAKDIYDLAHPENL